VVYCVKDATSNLCNLFHKNRLISHQIYIDQIKVGLNKPSHRKLWDIEA